MRDLMDKPAARKTDRSIPMEVRQAAADLIMDSTVHLDRMELDAWIECFDETAEYHVIPRENLEVGYGAAVIRCNSLDVIKDRLMVLDVSSKYNPHWDRHFLNGTQYLSYEDGILEARTNFMIVQSSLEGFSKLFVAGHYEDKIVMTDAGPRLRSRVVVLDTFSVPNLIAVPL
ncbi:aromatic-ring-hydroxylating dioxygenase subunit beta [Poseidonocella sp. HB161398]|uniref:aromatic-ring-hydroxylating dioxygenase subunit beta n=1 Tax=Poseidonocella sp. HB161398 TaxID=2320855 RepID=UPI0011090978|nr:aromatic-ring-hydroxylating dioxygenase subunit beta [Poseidonocella sp. HB161398]